MEKIGVKSRKNIKIAIETVKKRKFLEQSQFLTKI